MLGHGLLLLSVFFHSGPSFSFVVSMFFAGAALFSFDFQCFSMLWHCFPLFYNVCSIVGIVFLCFSTLFLGWAWFSIFFNIFLGLLIVGHSFPLFFNLSYDVHIGIWVIEKHHLILGMGGPTRPSWEKYRGSNSSGERESRCTGAVCPRTAEAGNTRPIFLWGAPREPSLPSDPGEGPRECRTRLTPSMVLRGVGSL